MAVCVCICDNVTTCDNLKYRGRHAVSVCLNAVCDNVTTEQVRTPIRANLRAYENIMSQMSQCHISKVINSLWCDNLSVIGCHVVTPINQAGDREWNGWWLIHTGWILILVMQLASRGLLNELSILHGRLMSLSPVIGTRCRACWGVVAVVMQQLNYVWMIGLLSNQVYQGKKVLLKQGWYGSATRGISLVSRIFFGVSFRFSDYKTGG